MKRDRACTRQPAAVADLTGWRSLQASRAMASGWPHGGCAALDPGAGRCLGERVLHHHSRDHHVIPSRHPGSPGPQPGRCRVLLLPLLQRRLLARHRPAAMGSATKPVVGRFIGSNWDVEWLGVCRTFPQTKPPHFPLLAGVLSAALSLGAERP